MSEGVQDLDLRVHKAGHTKFNSWWLHDAKGIPLTRVCSDCEDLVRRQYRPEVFNPDKYADVVEERIEEDDP